MIKKLTFIIIISILILGLVIVLGGRYMFSWNTIWQNSNFESNTTAVGLKQLSSEQAKVLYDNRSAVFIDVRSITEFRSGHIPGALNISVDTLEFSVPNFNINKNQQIVVYCLSGIRSNRAGNLLLKLGYTDVYDLGGIANWKYSIE